MKKDSHTDLTEGTIAMSEFGKLLERKTPDEKILKPGEPGYPELSEETLREIEEIDRNSRNARATAHLFFVD